MPALKTGEKHTVVFPRDGIAVIDGLVVFTDGALAGEQAVIEITSVSKRYAKATVSALLSRSDERTAPECESYGRCGGCDLMHQCCEGQLKAKEKTVSDAVGRIGKIRGYEILPICPSPRVKNYRNKTEFRLSNDDFGFYSASTHDLVPVNDCLIASREAIYAAKLYREAAKSTGFTGGEILTVRNNRKGEYGVIIDAGRIDAVAAKAAEYISNDENCLGVLLRSKSEKRLFGERGIYETLRGKRFFVSHEAFFQVNTEQTENLYATVSEFLSADKDTVLLDAYCGVGTIGIAAAPEAREIIGIEVSEIAVADAEYNAKINGINNARYIAGRCEEKYSECEKYGVNAVVCDPPRAGCGRGFIEFLKRLMPEKIVYVSCDPATLARDLSLLSDVFSVRKLCAFDMFPQTKHVESVTLMTRNK